MYFFASHENSAVTGFTTTKGFFGYENLYCQGLLGASDYVADGGAANEVMFGDQFWGESQRRVGIDRRMTA